MGSICFDFLADSFLFDQNLISNLYRDFDDDRLLLELANYRSYINDQYRDLILDINKSNSEISVFTSEELVPIELLKQTALYLNQYIISDPIIRFTESRSEFSKTASVTLGYGSEDKINRMDIIKAVRYLKQITPMIAGNYVKLYPTNLFFEAPQTPSINYPINYYSDVLPADLTNLLKERVKISSLHLENGHFISDDQLNPTRRILIDFVDSPYDEKDIYHLQNFRPIAYDETTKQATFVVEMPDTPPTKDDFNIWVQQSINTSMISFIQKVYREIHHANILGAKYLTNSQLVSDTVSLNIEHNQQSIPEYTANVMLDIELPFIKDIDVTRLMQVRESETDIFNNFRIELEKSFREIRSIKDPFDLQYAKENIIHELANVQQHKIKTKIKELNIKLGINSALMLGGLASIVQTGGISLISCAIAAIQGYSNYTDYRSNVKDNPAYFLWKIKK
jgi:hypothetical protein